MSRSRPKGIHVLLGILLLASIAFLAHSLRSGSAKSAAQGENAAGPPADAAQLAVAEAMIPAAPEGIDFEWYRDLAGTNVFSSRRSAAPPQKPPEGPKPPQTLPPFEDPNPPAPRAKQPDFSGWSYRGYIMIDGEKRAMVQNDSSNSYRDFAVGDTFLGATVTEVTGKALRLKSGAVVTTLSVPELFPVVPLDKGAASVSRGGPRRTRPQRR